MSRIVVHRAGLLTTIQDDGRWGYQAQGVPVAGPMDRWSHRLANLLVRNEPTAATLEVTGVGPDLAFEHACAVAIAGAEFSGELDGQRWTSPVVLEAGAGSRLVFRERRRGMRAYVAVAGGIDVPAVLGSRATDLRSRLGGLDGRALRDGDCLRVSTQPSLPPRSGLSAAAVLATFADAPVGTSRSSVCRLRVLPGPDGGEEAFERLLAATCLVSPESDRMAYRLEATSALSGRELPVSGPVVNGAVQVPPSGDPILLMAERQTTGGYAVVAVVIAADLPLAGQLGPGDELTFEACSPETALAALIAREQALLALEDR